MNILKSKQIFISGGLGFIGSNLIKYIKSNNYKGKIIVYDNNSINNRIALDYIKNLSNVQLIIGELLDFKKLKFQALTLLFI